MTTHLLQQAWTLDISGQSVRVMDDEALLAWAAKNGLSPRQAQLEALENGVFPLRYLKNFQALTLEEQIRLCRGRVLICGCGGLGGVLIHLLARAGVGFLRLVDGDTFTASNLNRQWLCDTAELGRPKAVVGKERVALINPLVEVEAFSSLLDEGNADDLIRGTDLVLDALDNLPGRFLLAERARRLGIPMIHAAVAGWWGQMTTLLPDSSNGLHQIYGKKRSRDAAEEALGVLGPTAAVLGSLEALEALRLLAGKASAYSGKFLYFDGESGRTELLSLEPM